MSAPAVRFRVPRFIGPIAPLVALLALPALAGCTGGDGDGGGSSRTFWSWDLSVMPPVDQEVVATERAVTDHFYVYVEDTLWDTGEVDEALLADLVTTLEDETPSGSIDPSAGIVENDVATFGPIPDALDGDPRVYLLLMNIEGFQNFEFDGFFRAIDQMPDEQAVATQGYHSNEVEMLYVNAEIRPVSSETTKSVIAHELYHLLEWGQDSVEDGWLSEAMGELAMTVNGFYTDDEWVADFMAHPEESLFGGEFSVHYGACLLFANYLYERFGVEFVTDLVALGSDGTDSIDEALAAAGEPGTFESVFVDWVAANAAGDYAFADVPPVAPFLTVATNGGGAITSTAFEAASARYVEIATQDQKGFTFTPSVPGGFRAVVVQVDAEGVQAPLVTVPVDPTAFTVLVADPYDSALVGLVALSPMTVSGSYAQLASLAP